MLAFTGSPAAASSKPQNKAEVPMFDLSKSGEFSVQVSGPYELGIEGEQLNGPDLPMFNFNCVAVATDNFSEENKLGQGGFGPVYKVTMSSKHLCCKAQQMSSVCADIKHSFSVLLPGKASMWTRNCCEEALSPVWTRSRRVQE